MNRGRGRLLCGPFGLSLRPKPYASYTGQVMRPGCYRHDTNDTGSTRDARERELAGWSEVSAPSARACARPEYLVLSGFHGLNIIRARACAMLPHLLRGCSVFVAQ